MKSLGIGAFIVFCILLLARTTGGTMDWFWVFVPVIGWVALWLVKAIFGAIIATAQARRNLRMERAGQERRRKARASSESS